MTRLSAEAGNLVFLWPRGWFLRKNLYLRITTINQTTIRNMKRFFSISIIAALLISASFTASAQSAPNYPTTIESGPYKAGHIQGIAVDTERGYVYYSYTTQLIKTDLKGNIIGSVKGLLGHLGDMDFNKEDGRVYGSLEYKNDAIGKGIMLQEKSNKKLQNAFYLRCRSHHPHRYGCREGWHYDYGLSAHRTGGLSGEGGA